jgi:hypothetical protein
VTLSDEQIRRILASDGYPIVKLISRERDGIHYYVICGGAGGDDSENARGIWDRFVEFSANTRRQAGPVRFADDAAGPVFVEAARDQDRVAALALMILQEHGK